MACTCVSDTVCLYSLNSVSGFPNDELGMRSSGGGAGFHTVKLDARSFREEESSRRFSKTPPCRSMSHLVDIILHCRGFSCLVARLFCRLHALFHGFAYGTLVKVRLSRRSLQDAQCAVKHAPSRPPSAFKTRTASAAAARARRSASVSTGVLQSVHNDPGEGKSSTRLPDSSSPTVPHACSSSICLRIRPIPLLFKAARQTIAHGSWRWMRSKRRLKVLCRRRVYRFNATKSIFLRRRGRPLWTL